VNGYPNVVALAGVQFDRRLRNGTPVHLDDGREGWVEGVELSTREPIVNFTAYRVKLTSDRGTVTVPVGKLQPLAREPYPVRTALDPKGAA